MDPCVQWCASARTSILSISHQIAILAFIFDCKIIKCRNIDSLGCKPVVGCEGELSLEIVPRFFAQLLYSVEFLLCQGDGDVRTGLAQQADVEFASFVSLTGAKRIAREEDHHPGLIIVDDVHRGAIRWILGIDGVARTFLEAHREVFVLIFILCKIIDGHHEHIAVAFPGCNPYLAMHGSRGLGDSLDAFQTRRMTQALTYLDIRNGVIHQDPLGSSRARCRAAQCDTKPPGLLVFCAV